MTSRSKRQEARRARRLADGVNDAEVRERLLAYAGELEAEAVRTDQYQTTVQDQKDSQQQGLVKTARTTRTRNSRGSRNAHTGSFRIFR